MQYLWYREYREYREDHGRLEDSKTRRLKTREERLETREERESSELRTTVDEWVRVSPHGISVKGNRYVIYPGASG
jgi:hypothetical protein